MPHVMDAAALLAPLSFSKGFQPWHGPLRTVLRVASGALQAAAFAAVLALILAGPGCLWDRDSTVPQHQALSRR